ncbi:MAG: hypothetical protein K0Q87_161 [Neobacillus sp.]|nr:hypothetical protein [Neobacillus sp.]
MKKGIIALQHHKLSKKKIFFLTGLAVLAYVLVIIAFPHATFAKDDLKISVNKANTDFQSFGKSIFAGFAGTSFICIGFGWIGPRFMREWAKGHIFATITGIFFVACGVSVALYATNIFGG